MKLQNVAKYHRASWLPQKSLADGFGVVQQNWTLILKSLLLKPHAIFLSIALNKVY
jgi:hypothetical protein